ncbi:hypothetical protein EW146_g10061 [Bondarzewia mesenterica]|uniref:Protein kinase domain-containing protein n=1 Tax=Bondarzewia mesenterica TaxID=1095465 RepID=A0A4S4L0T1_9AGAM|nr:hypothetical protein EW146_g10061 [Bondarzewia mesenterica]
MNIDETRFPSYALLSPEQLKVYQAATERGLFNLLPDEVYWRDRYDLLLSHGYRLRPRYHPEWKPSWIGTRIDPTFCEDSITSVNYDVIDAVCLEDSSVVSIKIIRNNTSEIDIGRYLSTSSLITHPMNHCVPIFDSFNNPDEPNTSYIVMPYLRPFDDPPFGSVGEVVDFVRQTLEGLCFIHGQGVAHRDCASANIMMDASPLYPQGHHPVRTSATPDGTALASPLSRIDNPVRYYFIDFGISSQFPPGDLPMVTGAKGRDKELPELSRDIPYDAFKADIFILGNLYKQEFLQKFHGLDFLMLLVTSMAEHDPVRRPSAPAALSDFQKLKAGLNSINLRWRLRPRDESVPQRVVFDTVAVARETFYQLKRIVG